MVVAVLALPWLVAFVQGPLVATLEAKLLPISGVAGDRFGTRTVIEGDRAAIASIGVDNHSGAVDIYDRVGAVWHRTQRLKSPNNPQYDSFGLGLALVGEVLVVGAPNNSVLAPNAGAVFLYTFDGTQWSLQASLFASDAATNDFFGQSVALSGDTLLVGAPFEHIGNTQPGAAYVFRRNGAVWTQEAKLLPSAPTVNDRFGSVVDIAGDVAAISANEDDQTQLNSGAVYVWMRSGSTWTIDTKLKAADPNPGQDFGSHLDLDGSRLAVGAFGDDDAGYHSGAVYSFQFNGTAWTQQAKLVALAPSPSDSFGSSVSFSGDRLAVGAWHDSQVASTSGAAYVFREHNGAWQQALKIKAPDAQLDDGLGITVDIDGDTLVCGAFNDDDLGLEAGSVYIYDVAEQPLAYCTSQTNSLGCVPGISYTGQPSLTSSAAFTISTNAVLNNKAGLMFYGRNGRAQIPFLGGVLCMLGPVQRTSIVYSGGSSVGSDCSGALQFDFNAYLHSGLDVNLVAGTIVDAQFWYRDPAASGTVGLTDALEFVVHP